MTTSGIAASRRVIVVRVTQELVAPTPVPLPPDRPLTPRDIADLEVLRKYAEAGIQDLHRLKFDDASTP